MVETYENKAAPGVSYFTPAQVPASGTALGMEDEGKQIPALFKPLKIRGLEFQNRIFLSPLCQYSGQDGAMTAWHMAHLGGIASRGPGLTFTEATAVVPEGRITPQDLGLWSDAQIEPLRKVVEFVHSQNQKIGIQLAHAGRKASTVAPWLSFTAISTEEVGGWPKDVVGPSPVAFSETLVKPKELSKEDIKSIVKAFVEAAKRAVAAGIDVIEIHNAHGYLLHEFVSPISNKRTDEYGGSFENRIRLTLDIVDAVREVIPKDMPLFLRISATDWLEEVMPNEPSWTLDDTIKLAGILASHGVDLLDVSSGGNHPAQKITGGPRQHTPAYQAPFSAAIKAAHGDKILVGAVGGISTGSIAEDILKSGMADVAFVGRQFQKDPASVWTFAEDLGVKVKVAHQIEWGFRGRGSAGKIKSKV